MKKQFFKLLSLASQPVKTSRRVSKRHDGCIMRLFHKHTDLFVDSPSTLISNAKVPLKFFGSDSVLALANQKNGMKPHSKRCGTFVKNRSFCRVSLEAASASIGAAVGHWMERRLATLRAFQAIGVTILEYVCQASLVVGKVLF